jgi:GT2 family glycosyltransferase
MAESRAAVLVLNYNGQHFLNRFLHDVIRYSAPHQVYVADNASTDDSVAFVKSNFPGIQVIALEKNYGYAEGYNRAIAKLTADFYVLLNNDVEVTEGWLSELMMVMETEHDAGAVQPKLLDFARHELFEYAGASGGFIDRYGYPFCRGRVFNFLERDVAQYDSQTELFWASGACLCVRASAWHRAGGLDSRYFAHMEEIDLCWRIRNQGYRILAAPSSVVFHIGGGTLNKFSKQKTYLNFRNNLATLAKNHPGQTAWLKILYRLFLDGIAAAKFLADAQPKHFFAVIRAHFSFYAWLPELMRERRRLKKTPGFRFNLTGMYNGNIVWEHFILRKKKFSELHKSYKK